MKLLPPNKTAVRCALALTVGFLLGIIGARQRSSFDDSAGPKQSTLPASKDTGKWPAPFDKHGRGNGVARLPPMPADFQPAWNPWATTGKIAVPARFFQSQSYHIVWPEGELHAPLLKAMGIPEEQIAGVQANFRTLNERLVEADLRHRKITRNDGNTVEIEIPAYPEEAEAAYGQMQASVAASIGEEKAALLNAVLFNQAVISEWNSRGAWKRVYTMSGTEAGGLLIKEFRFVGEQGEGGGSQWDALGDVPRHLRHLFTAVELNPAEDSPAAEQ